MLSRQQLSVTLSQTTCEKPGVYFFNSKNNFRITVRTYFLKSQPVVKVVNEDNGIYLEETPPRSQAPLDRREHLARCRVARTVAFHFTFLWRYMYSWSVSLVKSDLHIVAYTPASYCQHAVMVSAGLEDAAELDQAPGQCLLQQHTPECPPTRRATPTVSILWLGPWRPLWWDPLHWHWKPDRAPERAGERFLSQRQPRRDNAPQFAVH